MAEALEDLVGRVAATHAQDGIARGLEDGLAAVVVAAGQRAVVPAG